MMVKQIKIDFNVTQEIKRFVYVYLIETAKGCVLIDSGVAGSELLIEKAILENGRHPAEIKAVFLYQTTSRAKIHAPKGVPNAAENNAAIPQIIYAECLFSSARVIFDTACAMLPPI